MIHMGGVDLNLKIVSVTYLSSANSKSCLHDVTSNRGLSRVYPRIMTSLDTQQKQRPTHLTLLP